MQARLIIEERPLSGTENMERDLHLLHEVEGGAPAALRLYRWVRPTVSLGRFQPEDDVDTAYAEKHGVDIVRRPTGGKGVFHDDELTYAFIASTRDGIPRGVEQSYRHISRALVAAFETLGVDFTQRAVIAKLDPPSSGACYLTISDADIAVDASKLSGSAQVWQGDTVLQHGCFVRSRQLDREAALFRLAPNEKERLSANATTLCETLEKTPSFDEISNAIIAAFSHYLDITFIR